MTHKISHAAVFLIAMQTALAKADSWVIDAEDDWAKSAAHTSGIKLGAGFATPEAAKGTFKSKVHTFAKPTQAKEIVFNQSPVWDNWTQIDDITPPGLGNAYVFLPVAPGDYYVLATKKSTAPIPKGLSKAEKKAHRKKHIPKGEKGYHAWHSADLKEWKHLGQVCWSNWVTTAEYFDGKFYIYYDEPNDQDPHLIVDNDLHDGIPGKDYGEVFADPTHGSDCGIFRDEDGTFHMIYEDWSPINARQNAWDSPLAGRVSSKDGIHGFTFGEHPAVVDHRTKPTGKMGTYEHSSMGVVNDGKPLEYEIHEPKQSAYGDWTVIKVGKNYHLFCDFDSADHTKSMRMGRFHGDDLNKEFTWSGEIGEGFHPDPSVGFAEGKFYVVMQQKTDFVSPGPWVDGVEAKVGVDVTGDGKIDQWTGWKRVKEAYSQKPGFARIVDVDPARIDLSGLPKGLGFQFEFRTTQLGESSIQPIMDRVELQFE
jgi:hypothetical protein